MNQNSKDPLTLCKEIRQIATDTLCETLEQVLETEKLVSEAEICDIWLSEFRKHKELFPDGWYLPPPHGISALFATEKNPGRLDFKSLRKEHNWPRKDIFLNQENGFAFLYSSPIGKHGIIGDIEATIYFGKNNETKEYLKLYFKILEQIVDAIKIGTTTFKDLFDYSEVLFDKNNLINAIVSVTDPTSDNIGHSIPFIDDEITKQEKNILDGKDWNAACKMISNKRIFLNCKEEVIIKPNMAFTIEPGVKIKEREDMPFIAFHTIVLVHNNGKIEWIKGFDKLFKLTGMDYMV